MQKIRILIAGLVLSAVALAPLMAVDETIETGTIIFATGDELAIQNKAGYTSYRVGKESVIGLPVNQGDLILTGRGTMVEVRLQPSGSVIRIAENTTLKLNLLSRQKTDLEVVYGRIRAKVQNLVDRDSFQVRGQSAVAGVRGTDFGFDVLVRPDLSAKPSTNVYCFEGVVAIVPVQAGSQEAVEPVVLKQNQSIVVVDPASLKESAPLSGERLQRGMLILVVNNSIPQIISDFWQAAPKAETPPAVVTAPEQPGTSPAPQSDNPAPPAVTAAIPPRRSLADQLPPLEAAASLDVMPKAQYVYGPDDQKTIGVVSTATGLAITVLSAVIGTYGNEFFGLDRQGSATFGNAGVISGISITSIGAFIYLWGALDH